MSHLGLSTQSLILGALSSETFSDWRLLQENAAAMAHTDCPALPLSPWPRLGSCPRLQGSVFHWCVFVFAALNGFLFGNFPEPEMCVGESVSWHLFGMGNEIDIHSIYFYGNTFITRGHRADVVNLFPATFLTTEMIVENPGKWMITCQVSDHLQGKTGGDCGEARDGAVLPDHGALK